MTIATIDIGTNTVLLLVASVDAGGAITPLAHEQRLPRLGQGVDRSGRLQDDAMERAEHVLAEYRRILAPYRPGSVVAFATSAVRDAVNREEFGKLVNDAIGVPLEVLSGPEEALWTYRGALSGARGAGTATVIDIGGGSTEISSGTDAGVMESISLNIGSVRLTERFFAHDPPRPAELDSARTMIRESLLRAESRAGARTSRLIGVAGTATTLAVLAQHLPEFEMNAVAGYRLSRRSVGELLARLSTMRSSAIMQLSSVMQGRHDIIVAGTMILDEFMAMFGFSEMTVSERGVRYGVVIREWEKSRTG